MSPYTLLPWHRMQGMSVATPHVFALCCDKVEIGVETSGEGKETSIQFNIFHGN